MKIKNEGGGGGGKDIKIFSFQMFSRHPGGIDGAEGGIFPDPHVSYRLREESRGWRDWLLPRYEIQVPPFRLKSIFIFC